MAMRKGDRVTFEPLKGRSRAALMSRRLSAHPWVVTHVYTAPKPKLKKERTK